MTKKHLPLFSGKLIFTVLSATITHQLSAQALTEKTGIRFYEHHSSAMTGMPMGNGAVGTQSGYDFIEKRYFNSFDAQTMGAYSNGEEANLDMVEHNGPFGTNGASQYLGFTSGVSTIWDGDIKGNGTTRWMAAPVGFNYATVSTVTDLSSAYNPTTASEAIAEVRKDKVYIGKIRGTGMYVAIKCTNTEIASGPPNGQTDDVFFDFDYKYGSLATGINEVRNSAVSVYPNPSNDYISVNLNNGQEVQSLKISSLLGEELLQVNQPGSQSKMDISTLPSGLYLLSVATADGRTLVKSVLKKADQ
jgi:hypothetical protein